MKPMKKFVLTLSFVAFAVAASAQEKPQTAEQKHVCTEKCDHGMAATVEKKSCCSEKGAEAKSCSDKKEAAMRSRSIDLLLAAPKSCCSEKATASAASC